MKGTGAKRNVCPGSCVSTGAKFPVAPVESAPMCTMADGMMQLVQRTRRLGVGTPPPPHFAKGTTKFYSRSTRGSANLHKRGLAQSRSCDCGQRQTMNHIVDTCPLTKSEGGLNRLHEADDDAVILLESTATAALAK